MDIINNLSDSVLFLFSESSGSPIGTAFVIGYPVPNVDNLIIPLIVTAKHVLADFDRVVGRFSMKSGQQPGHILYDLNQARDAGDLWEHPDDGVDIVIFRTLHVLESDYQIINPSLVATREIFESEMIAVTDRVVIPSMLLNFMGETRNFPVFRKGDIALIPTEKVPLQYKVGSQQIKTAQEVLFIDAIAIQGASGSPVFLWPGPRLKGRTFTVGGGTPYLLGVVHGFYPSLPREVIEIQSDTAKPFFAENSGIAIVFPATRILEILESDELKSRIDSLVKDIK